MITLDRTSSTSLAAQLAVQLRFAIASGRYRIGDRLPSTRELAQQLSVSFHTVRKAYQLLEGEGLLRSTPGARYEVAERRVATKEDRMERGAIIAKKALVQMVSLGLSEADIEYLIEEQLSLMASEVPGSKAVVLGLYREMAERCSEQLRRMLQLDSLPATLDSLSAHADADYVLAPIRLVQAATRTVAGADVIGVTTAFATQLLEELARLSSDSTVVMIVRDRDAIQPLMQDIRNITGFSGQIIGLSSGEKHDKIDASVEEAALVLATPSSLRRLPGQLRSKTKLLSLDPLISEASLSRIVSLVPR